MTDKRNAMFKSLRQVAEQTACTFTIRLIDMVDNSEENIFHEPEDIDTPFSASYEDEIAGMVESVLTDLKHEIKLMADEQINLLGIKIDKAVKEHLNRE